MAETAVSELRGVRDELERAAVLGRITSEELTDVAEALSTIQRILDRARRVDLRQES